MAGCLEAPSPEKTCTQMRAPAPRNGEEPGRLSPETEWFQASCLPSARQVRRYREGRGPGSPREEPSASGPCHPGWLPEWREPAGSHGEALRSALLCPWQLSSLPVQVSPPLCQRNRHKAERESGRQRGYSQGCSAETAIPNLTLSAREATARTQAALAFSGHTWARHTHHPRFRQPSPQAQNLREVECPSPR